MSLRDRLVPWIGRRREPAPAEPTRPESAPAPAAAPTEAAPPPAEPAGPRPRIVLLGTEPRAVGLIELYGLAGRDDIALSDRRPGRDAGEAHGHRVWSFDALALDRLDAVLVTEDPIGDYADALRFLEEKGVPPERIATAAQPGRAHRALSRVVAHPPERNREIGHLAVRRNLWHRGHYAYCMVLAAETALRMSLSRVTAIEFGVWYGAGLKNLCEIADFLHQTLGVEFRVWGFDTGAGLPEVADWRDHPEIWAGGDFAMPDFAALAAELPANCRLVIGDCEDTLGPVLREHGSADAPVGFVSLDVDQYHSSVSALKVFEAEAAHLAPVVPVWVDDAYIGVLQTSYAGEGLAIREFNGAHALRKIERKVVRTDDHPRLWHHCVHFAHVFDHPVRQGRARARFEHFYHTDY
jgi:hypothetical protein